MAETVALIDYGSGNLRSAAKALERAAGEAGRGQRIVVTDDPAVVAAADRLVLPGVGAFADCMAGLAGRPGLLPAMTEAAREQGRPFLGICVGMQLLASRGVEYGAHEGLGWIAGEVVRLTPAAPALKVPHMGWNALDSVAPHPVLAGLDRGSYCYFVHSFHFRAVAADEVLASVDYGGPVTAVVGRDNLVGTQFHPEKSQAAGLRLLANFLAWSP
ncbi:MAG TPA: imidazole glycerol phosphate synthase subunit HisH [Kiloniellales bacterium]|nr:imidazole glycerol phosphate synthase subunit HisH [Kiloniellales bacterium]